MALSEDMEKIDNAIEIAVRKIERQYVDICSSVKSGTRMEALLIDGVPVERYLPSFVWEHAKYPHRRALPELVQSLRGTVGAMEEELKQLATTYADKNQKVSSFARGGGGSKGKGLTASALSTLPLEEFLPPDAAVKAEAKETDYLTTIAIIVPKSLEETFLGSYQKIGHDLVETADGTKCSPAVPGTLKKLYAEGDAVIFVLTILKGRQMIGKYNEDDVWQPGAFVDFVSLYTAAAKHHGVFVLPFNYDADFVAKMEKERQELSTEVERLHATILRWCKAHFAEAFVAWMHLKVIRAFVESVLRYGLPVDFLLAILIPNKNRDSYLQKSLDAMFAHLKSQFLGGPADESLDTPAGSSKDAVDYHPYVLQKATAVSI